MPVPDSADRSDQRDGAAAVVDDRLAYHTVNCRGVFQHDWHAPKFPGFTDVVKWRSSSSPPKFPTALEAAARVPSVDSVDFAALARPPCGPSSVQVTWMGHASFLVQVGGINILTDPVFSERCAPVQFAGPRRYVPPPVALSDFDQLPRIHIVSISHNHYDHLDLATVKRLREVHEPTFVVPLKMKSWFASLGWKPSAQEERDGVHDPAATKVIELDWWECRSVPVATAAGAARLSVTFTPVQHWSMRTGPWDRNKQLWGAFVFEVRVPNVPEAAAVAPTSPSESSIVRRVFHSGDTGYNDAIFKQVGAVFRRFDLALLPIGAYAPRWFMSVQHVDPAQAVQMHLDLHRPTLSVGMHWGTFILTDEPIDEPPRLLSQCAREGGLEPTEFVAVKHGETLVVGTKRQS